MHHTGGQNDCSVTSAVNRLVFVVMLYSVASLLLSQINLILPLVFAANMQRCSVTVWTCHRCSRWFLLIKLATYSCCSLFLCCESKKFRRVFVINFCKILANCWNSLLRKLAIK